MPPTGILLVSEIYPPVIGGSGVLLENLYSRLSGVPVRVLAHGNTPPRLQRGLPVDSLPMDASDWGVLRPRSLRRHLRTARAIRRLSRPEDVVHCARALPEGLSAWLSGRPFVCWVHGEELGFASSSRELSWLMRRVFRSARGVLANSNNSAGLLERWGVDPERISVVHPGVDAARFHPGIDAAGLRSRLSGAGEVVLLSVGRLQRRKGHDLVLQALSTWTPADPPVRYVIAGDGSGRAELERQAAALGVQDRVTFLGNIAEDDLPGLYAASDIFVLPNRTDGVDFEGFGIVFLEAAATGRPVIGGRSGGVAEAIADGETGVLVSGTDHEELAVAIKRLASSPDERARFGAAGRDRVVRAFTWDAGASRLAALHRSSTSEP